MTSLIDQIIDYKTREALDIQRDFDESFLKAAAFSVGREFRSLAIDAKSATSLLLIPEFKATLFPEMIELEGFEPMASLKTLQKAGLNNGVIVATDPHFLGGDPGWMNYIKSSSEYPIIQRDFFIDPVQIYQGKAIGADAFLIDTAYTPTDKLAAILDASDEMGLEAYLEVNDFKIPEGIDVQSVNGVIVNISNPFAIEDIKKLAEIQLKFARFLPAQTSEVQAIRDAGFHGIVLNDLFWQQPDFTATFQKIRSWCDAIS